MLVLLDLSIVFFPDVHTEDIGDIIIYLFHYSGSLLPHINIHQHREKIRHSMLAHLVFQDTKTDK